MSALQWVDVPGYAAILFRRTYADLSLPGALMDRAKEWLMGTAARWHDRDKTWTFPSGATVSFGYLEHKDDKYRYQSAEFQMVGFDELTQFCLHPDHEVLTRIGWVPIAQVKPGDQIVSLSPDFRSEYSSVVRTWEFPFDGSLVSVRHQAIAYDVTPNHRVVIDRQNGGKWRFAQAESMPAFAYHPLHSQWQGEEISVMSLPPVSGRGIGKNQNSASALPMDDWLELLGWYLSEGSAFVSKTTPTVSIRQTKPAPSLDALVRRLPWRASPDGEGGHRIHSRQLYNLLHPLGDTYTKRVPRYVMHLSARQLRIFFDAFMAGDGSKVDSGAYSLSLANKGLIDDLQEIACKLGLRSTSTMAQSSTSNAKGKRYPTWRLSVYRPGGHRAEVREKHRYVMRYKGPVHCVTVEPHHTFLVRKNGKVFWSGNTEPQYTYLFSRLRRLAAVQIPLRMRAATNPGGSGHSWVKNRFIPNEFFQSPEEAQFAGVWRKDGRVFVPAKLEDNPNLDIPRYEQSLSLLDPVTRAQLRKGDWKAHAGGRFNPAWWRRYKDIGDQWILLDSGDRIVKWQTPRVVTVDPANRKTKASKYTAMGVFADAGRQRCLVLDMTRRQLGIEEIVPALHTVCRRWEPVDWVGIESNGFQIAITREARDKRRYPYIPTVIEMDPQGKSKLTRATPAIIRAEQGQMYLPEEAAWVDDYVAELAQFTGDEKEDGYTDQVDVTAYAISGMDRFGVGDESEPMVIEGGFRAR